MNTRTLNGESCGLDFSALEAGFRAGGFSPSDLLTEMHERGSAESAAGVWIHRIAKDELLRRLAELEQRRVAGATLPLYGLPFAVKDNIDVVGMPTTAACPAFTYTPKRSAVAVERLTSAGAIVVGKTNLDQFATGLVGVRSPYGIPRNPFDRRYIPGGSSSGSAVAVSTGMAAFALGTDTAGSGRVPAAFNNIVGLKPSRGLISTIGVVPACASLDCVSVFALTCTDAWRVLEIAGNLGSTKQEPPLIPAVPFRFGVPGGTDLEFFGDPLAQAAFSQAVATLRDIGGKPVKIDFSPFLEAARLLYDGPWVVERLVAAGELLTSAPDALDPVVRDILCTAERFDAGSVFRAQAHLGLIAERAQLLWRDVDVLVTPTAPTIYTLAQIQVDPLRLNTNLGYYTNFVNLLDLCALAVPAGFRADDLPFGITLMAPRGHDARLAALGARYHAASSQTLGASSRSWSDATQASFSPGKDEGICLAVVGAHLSGEPLNHQLTDAGATLVKPARTAACYRLFALENTTPPKPGLVRADGGEGAAVELEIWRLSAEAFGRFVAKIPAPLCVGSIELADGEWVHGFLCESHAVAHARDISSFGGWRAYRRSLGVVLR